MYVNTCVFQLTVFKTRSWMKNIYVKLDVVFFWYLAVFQYLAILFACCFLGEPRNVTVL